MSTHNLHKLFNPKSVAVVGASEKRGSVGFSIMRNLLKHNFNGRVYPVNPEHGSVMGRPCFKNLEDIPSRIDIAIITKPINYAPEIVELCGIAGITCVVIISTNNMETKQKTQTLEKKILINARKYNMRVIGPNCFGIVNTSKNLNASFTNLVPLTGEIAFISQSGAVCTSVLDLANKKKIGFSHIASIGPMLDIDFADMIDYLGAQTSVKSIIMYIENIKNIRSFMSAARSVSRVKPLIVLKPGISTKKGIPEIPNTSHSIKEDAIYDAAFQRAGILRVNEFAELLDCSEFLSKGGHPSGPGLTIITDTGGQGLMAADTLVAQGIKPSTLQKGTIEKLDKALPANWNYENNIIILENTRAKIYAAAAKICANAPETDALLLICSPSETMDTFSLAKSLATGLKTLPCPIFTAWTGGDNIKEIKQFFNQAGIVTYDSARLAVMAFKNLHKYKRNMEAIMEIPIRTDKKLLINQKEAKIIIKTAIDKGNQSLTKTQTIDLLYYYGIGNSKNIILDLKESPIEKLKGTTDYALAFGAEKNPNFGPVVFFGMGGVLTKVFNDISIGLPPLNRSLARQMIEATKISKILKGDEDAEEISLGLIEELLIRISRLMTDFPEITSLHINPLIIENGDIMISDARINVAQHKSLKPSDHLVISSYPWQYEKKGYTTTKDEFFIRPLRPSDAGLLIDHFHSLSQKSVYLRFFSPLKHLSKTMLIQLTQIDYDREIALIAIKGKGWDKKIIGVCRIITDPDKSLGEYAMAISDAWQGKGVGSALLKQCLKAAKNMEVKRVMGIVMGENTQMLKLGKKLGFSINRVPSSSEYELTIDLINMNNH